MQIVRYSFKQMRTLFTFLAFRTGSFDQGSLCCAISKRFSCDCFSLGRRQEIRSHRKVIFVDFKTTSLISSLTKGSNILYVRSISQRTSAPPILALSTNRNASSLIKMSCDIGSFEGPILRFRAGLHELDT